jgi:hypothetical protein
MDDDAEQDGGGIGCRARRKENQIKQKLFAWKRNTKIPEGTKRQKEDFVGRPQGSGSLGKSYHGPLLASCRWRRTLYCASLIVIDFFRFLRALME